MKEAWKSLVNTASLASIIDLLVSGLRTAERSQKLQRLGPSHLASERPGNSARLANLSLSLPGHSQSYSFGLGESSRPAYGVLLDGALSQVQTSLGNDLRRSLVRREER